MKALLLLAVVASTAYVGYSYTSTDGQSCAVCPMTGKPLFTSTEPEAGPCCADKDETLLTSVPGADSACCSKAMSSCCSEADSETVLTSVPGVTSDSAACCSQAKSNCCSKGEAEVTLTSASDAECHGDCEKGCCKDKTDSVDVTANQDEIAGEEDVEVAAAVTETE